MDITPPCYHRSRSPSLLLLSRLLVGILVIIRRPDPPIPVIIPAPDPPLNSIIVFGIVIIVDDHPIILKLVHILVRIRSLSAIVFVIFILVLIFFLFGMISGDIVTRDIGDSGTFDAVDDVGGRTADDSDGVETGNVVDCSGQTGKWKDDDISKEWLEMQKGNSSSPFRCHRATQESFGRSTAMTPSNCTDVHCLI